MPDRTITTDTGTTITATEEGGETLVVLDNPGARADMRNLEAGRIVTGGFQPAPFAAWGLTPSALRAIADLIEGADRA
ncbi:hypothetical protein IRT45_35225 [Nocardia sp. BSTN01]|uniref:hypothetical protein n=1 Tax=Nocardia sp. BSTN01 TaxID=2783665 RepID=UPI0018902C46|nr:hypothetical protein [Nocardia sp. BSTN01]MBF5002371.1 hypothetical protein [Nocardia sp. BSTN01]